MATNAVRWLRDYLTARDLDSEVAGGSVVDRLNGKPPHFDARRVEESRIVNSHGGRSRDEHLDVDHWSAQPLLLARLPEPLAPQVRSVAVTSLIIFGALCGAGALYVVGGAAAVVLMPIVMGREGVGTAMITLFTVCVTFMTSGVLLLAARSAARVIRRERRGARTLYLFSVTAVIVAAVVCGITYWLKVAFFDSDSPASSSAYATTAAIIAPLILMAWFARAAIVLRKYARAIISTR